MIAFAQRRKGTSMKLVRVNFSIHGTEGNDKVVNVYMDFPFHGEGDLVDCVNIARDAMDAIGKSAFPKGSEGSFCGIGVLDAIQ